MPVPNRAKIAGGIAATAVVVSLPLIWATASATPHESPDKTETIVLPWKVTFRQHDVTPKGISSGDTIQAEFTFTGVRKGTADFACTAVNTHYVCQGIIRLTEGDIYAQTGPVDETEPAAIVGGTREFVAATGQFTQAEHATPDGDHTGEWTLELHGPRR